LFVSSINNSRIPAFSFYPESGCETFLAVFLKAFNASEICRSQLNLDSKIEEIISTGLYQSKRLLIIESQSSQSIPLIEKLNQEVAKTHPIMVMNKIRIEENNSNKMDFHPEKYEHWIEFQFIHKHQVTETNLLLELPNLIRKCSQTYNTISQSMKNMNKI